MFSHIILWCSVLIALLSTGTHGASNVCICRCCYLGNCEPVNNATFFVQDCEECSTQRCLEAMNLEGARRKTAAVLEQVEEEISEGEKDEDAIDACIIISLLERSSCGNDASKCKVTTTFNAFCVDRNWAFGRFSSFVFIAVTGFLIVFGLFKDHIPALHSFNLRYFNY